MTNQKTKRLQKKICKIDGIKPAVAVEIKKNIAGIAKKLAEEYKKDETIKKTGSEKIPSKNSIIEIIEELEYMLFPGYFGDQDITESSLEYNIGSNIFKLFDKLSEQVSKSFRHKCASDHYRMCVDCYNQGIILAGKTLERLPEIRKTLNEDINAAFDGDPAAKSVDEIVFSYPGFKAVFIYRIAHSLYEMQIPLIPRIMTEYAHSITGIDIHPGARIGKRFFIDHGTGVVIGETTVIGNDVKIYQGVTLGALSVPKSKNGKNVDLKKKRHPTIEDESVIYAGATILGGDTVIGKGSVIGGNVWLTESVKPFSKVMSQQCGLNYFSNKQNFQK